MLCLYIHVPPMHRRIAAAPGREVPVTGSDGVASACKQTFVRHEVSDGRVHAGTERGKAWENGPFKLERVYRISNIQLRALIPFCNGSFFYSFYTLQTFVTTLHKMLRELFKVEQTVQVVDSLFIWTSARIIGFLSDWSVRVMWVDYPKEPFADVTVPENHRSGSPWCREQWNIRLSQKAPVFELKRNQRRQKKEALDIAGHRLSRGDVVSLLTLLTNI